MARLLKKTTNNAVRSVAGTSQIAVIIVREPVTTRIKTVVSVHSPVRLSAATRVVL
jgi:hypothetical protein